MGQAMILLLLIAALVPRMLTAQNISGVRSSRSDAALKAIAQMVHDIDERMRNTSGRRRAGSRP